MKCSSTRAEWVFRASARGEEEDALGEELSRQGAEEDLLVIGEGETGDGAGTAARARSRSLASFRAASQRGTPERKPSRVSFVVSVKRHDSSFRFGMGREEKRFHASCWPTRHHEGKPATVEASKSGAEVIGWEEEAAALDSAPHGSESVWDMVRGKGMTKGET